MSTAMTDTKTPRLAALLASGSPPLNLEEAAENYAELVTLADNLERELAEAKREVMYLRHYGNKDCTHMADKAMADRTMEQPW
jgi:hypothetical protein